MLVTTSVHDGESSLHRSARQDQIRLPHHHGGGQEVACQPCPPPIIYIF